MKTIVDVEIVPTPETRVAPLELLEDFADVAPTWVYLEEESQFYAAEKQVPACVLRLVDQVGPQGIDFAFAAADQSLHSPLHLVLIASAAPDQVLNVELRHRIIERFLDAFRSYLQGQPHVADVRTMEAEVAESL